MDLPSSIVMFHYNDEADTMYVYFGHPSKSVDSEIVDGLFKKAFLVKRPKTL